MFYSKGKMNRNKGYPEKRFILAVLRQNTADEGGRSMIPFRRILVCACSYEDRDTQYCGYERVI